MGDIGIYRVENLGFPKVRFKFGVPISRIIVSYVYMGFPLLIEMIKRSSRYLQTLVINQAE